MAVTQIVDLHEIADRDAELLCDGRQCIAAFDDILVFTLLHSMPFPLIYLREQTHCVRRISMRHPQLVSRGDALQTFPHCFTQRRIMSAQFGQWNAKLLGDAFRGNVGVHIHRRVARRWVSGECTEIMAGVARDIQGGEERHVEIARCKPESPAAVAAHDWRNIGGADFARRASHTRSTVVICSNRQRPGPRGGVIVFQQAGGGDGGNKRIAPFVHGAIDLHIAASGGARELPQSRSAAVRIGKRVVG